MSEKMNDKTTYRKLMEPFPSPAEADAAVRDFHDELRELREKYGIPDLLTVIRVTVITESGEEGACLLTLFMGAEELAEGMAAHAFGREQQRRQERIAKSLQVAIQSRR